MMNVIVNKKSLINALVEAMSEADEQPEFDRVNVHEDEPIVPNEMMSTQLAEVMPPVGDPEFIPASIEELSASAQAIALEVPVTEIDYFYRKLHELLDTCLDREAEKAMKIESIVYKILSEADSMKDAFLKQAADRLSDGEDSYDIAVELISSQTEFEDEDAEELSSKIQMISYGLDQEDSEENSAEDTKTQEKPAVEPEQAEPDSKESDDDFEYSDEDYDKDLSREISDESEESIASDIVDLIVKKGLHTTVLKDPETGTKEMVPVVIIDPKTGDFKMSEKEMRVLASESYGWEIIKNAMQMSDISALFNKLSKVAGDDKKAYLWLYSNLNNVLGKEGTPVSSELGAEMYANQIADTIGKYGEAVKEQLLAMAGQAEKKTKDVAVQIGKTKMVKKDRKDWATFKPEWEEDFSDVVKVTVPPGEMAAALRLVADQRLEAPRKGRPRLYDEDEPREAMTPEMRKQIRAERRKAELELEYEPGKMHLSPKALRAMMDKIAADLGIKLGNVRNVIYDDLKVYGLPAEDLRKMLDINIPGGREKIPFTYDPLRVQAKEKIVEKLYEMYRNAMLAYVEEVANSGDEADRDIGESYKDLFFGDGGLYQPGLDGYIKLQSQVGGPTLDDPDSIDVDDIAFKTKRKAFDFVQEFIDQVAKEWLDPDSDEYKQAKEGGMRAFLNSLVNDETFSNVSSRSDIDKIIDSEVNSIASSMDTEKLKEIIDVVFDKAPRRTKKYIARVKKELGK